jgi:hypothetical protein
MFLVVCYRMNVFALSSNPREESIGSCATVFDRPALLYCTSLIDVEAHEKKKCHQEAVRALAPVAAETAPLTEP